MQQAQTEGSATENDVRGLKAELKKAEAALKRSKTKDYYKILGIPRDCGDAEIKKAYRRESLKHHPDKVGSTLMTPRKHKYLNSYIGWRGREI